MMRFAVLLLVSGCGLCACWTDWLPAADKAAKPVDGGKRYLLRYRFRANTSVRYRVTSSSEIRQVSGSAKAVVRNETRTEKHYDVTAVDEQGNGLLEPVIDAVVLSAQFGDGPKKSYDSRLAKPPLPQFKGVAKTIGRPLVRLKIAPNGTLLQAVPLIGRSLQAGVTKNNGPATPSNDPSKNFLVELPQKPVRAGDTWTDESLKVRLQVDQSLKLYRTYVILRKYKLTSVKDGLATIEFSMATKQPVNEPRLQVQLVQRLMTGTIVFDVNRGLIVSRKLAADNEVFGYSGPQSKLHVKMTHVEQLVGKP